MNSDLIERYIYAATKRLSAKQRDDVSMELRSLIDDMLTERCGDHLPTEKDVRVVLTELGTPQELYEKYDENADQCLIGQPYYSTYKFVLKIVLASVTIGILISSLILQIMEPKEIIEAVGTSLSMVYNSLLSAFAIVTLLFAFFQRKSVNISEPFRFEDLPPVPKNSREISKWESISGIGFCVIFAVLFLAVPEVFSMYTDGMRIAIFDPETLRKTWPLILLFAACGIFREAVQLLEGEYNRKVLVTALVTDVISAVLCIWWLTGFQMLNPAFVGMAENLFASESEFICELFRRFDLFFLGCMLLALVLDAADVSFRTLRK